MTQIQFRVALHSGSPWWQRLLGAVVVLSLLALVALLFFGLWLVAGVVVLGALAIGAVRMLMPSRRAKSDKIIDVTPRLPR